jgi:hypothetical protein
VFSGGFRHRVVIQLKDDTEHQLVVNRPRAVFFAELKPDAMAKYVLNTLIL